MASLDEGKAPMLCPLMSPVTLYHMDIVWPVTRSLTNSETTWHQVDLPPGGVKEQEVQCIMDIVYAKQHAVF